MNQIVRVLGATLAGALLLGTAACSKRTILQFEDHNRHPATAMQAGMVKNYVFWVTAEHQFYSCSEQGDKLVCKRLCGGQTDLECPKAMAAGRSGATNVR
jgi:hypothetical protein